MIAAASAIGLRRTMQMQPLTAARMRTALDVRLLLGRPTEVAFSETTMNCWRTRLQTTLLTLFTANPTRNNQP
jgi:hypothetical protein